MVLKEGIKWKEFRKEGEAGHKFIGKMGRKKFGFVQENQPVFYCDVPENPNRQLKWMWCLHINGQVGYSKTVEEAEKQMNVSFVDYILTKYFVI